MNKPTILYIEDDSNDVLLFQQACRKLESELNVTSVGDGDEAIAYLNRDAPFADPRQHPTPVLVLLDLKMPRMNGFEVLSWMRNDPRYRSLPVVVFSSSNHPADVRRAYELGANSFLLKPVGFEALVGVARALQLYWLKLNLCPES